MITRINVAVDAGKSATKSVTTIDGKLFKQKFPTKVMAIENSGIDVPKGSYLVRYKGKEYLVGDIVGSNSTDHNVSKKTIDTMISTYLSIGKIVEKTGADFINLAIGMPQSLYKNSTLKKEFENFILGDRKIRIEINGREINFFLSKVYIFPEAMGDIYSSANYYKNKTSTVIDIGGLNVSYCQYKGLIPIYSTMVTSNLGVFSFLSHASEILSTKYGIYFEISDVEQIFHDGIVTLDGKQIEDSPKLLKDLKTKHLNKIISFGEGRGLSFKASSKIVFSGGGSKFFSNIKEMFPHSIMPTEDPQYANVFSFLKILDIKVGD